MRRFKKGDIVTVDMDFPGDDSYKKGYVLKYEKIDGSRYVYIRFPHGDYYVRRDVVRLVSMQEYIIQEARKELEWV